MPITIKDSSDVMVALPWNYIHSGRGLTANSQLYQNIQDVKVINDTVVFLTNNISLSSGLSNITEDKGLAWNSYYTVYDYCVSSKDSVDIRTQQPITYPQFLISVPLQTEKFNILELKTVLYDNILWNNDSQNKKYVSLDYGNNQFNFDGDFNINYYQNKELKVFKSDTVTDFTQEMNIFTIPLSSTDFIEYGAIGGSSPECSDNIFWDTDEYTCREINAGLFNGTLRCSWLSASPNICGNVDYVWMDRWETGIIPNSATEFPNIDNTRKYIDLPSSIQIATNESYTYKRYGSEYNNEYAGNLIQTAVFTLSSQDSDIIDPIGNINIINNGVTVNEEIFSFDNAAYLELQNTVGFNELVSYTIGIGMKKPKWSCGKTHQLIGNYYKGGKGIFYNSGGFSAIISAANTDGNINGFNHQLFKIFDKDLEADTGNPVTITEIQTDLDFSRWILDNTNHIIYKLEIDNILTEKIILPDNSDIISMAVDNNNRLFVLDTFNRTISGFNPDGTLSTTVTGIDRSNKAISFDLNNTLLYDNAVKIVVDKNNDIFSAHGSSIYKNGNRLFPIGNKISDILFDKNNNLWISDDTGIIKIINTDGILIKTIQIPNQYKNELTKTLFGMNIYDETTQCESEQIWVLMICSKALLRYDLDYNIVGIDNLGTVSSSGGCLSNSEFVIKGDFSGYDINRRIHIEDGEYISSTNPHITAKAKLRGFCGEDINVILNHPAKDLSPDKWHYFALVHDYDTKKFELIIDGEIVDSVVITENYENLNNSTSAYFIGTSSGKIGTENEERGLAQENFAVDVFNATIWDYPLDSWDINSLFNIKANEFSDMYYAMPVQPKNACETVKRFHIFNIPGQRSNKFNLVISGMGLEDDTKIIAENYIQEIIKGIKPANTDLHNIIWR